MTSLVDSIRVIDPSKFATETELPRDNAKTDRPHVFESFVVNHDPHMVVIPNFLAPYECEHFLEIARGHYTHSMVGSSEYEKLDDIGGMEPRRTQNRTSCSFTMRPAQTGLVENIEHRLATLAELPVDHLERLIVVRYFPGQMFGEHHDGRSRPRTIFIYLNDLDENDGGDTFFPSLGLSFLPRAGCAVMWSNTTAEGLMDSRMVHAGRPPLKGTKYGVNCFFNQKIFRVVSEPISRQLSHTSAFRMDVQKLGTDAIELDTEPEVTIVPGFANLEETTYLLSLKHNNVAESGSELTVLGAAKPLLTLDINGSSIVTELEARLAELANYPLDHLGPMRIMQSATKSDKYDRGLGQKIALLCLSDCDEVLFPHFKMCIVLHRGDLLVWPNTYWNEPSDDARLWPVEDLRTLNFHVAPSLCLEASFHDIRIRTQLLADAIAASPAVSNFSVAVDPVSKPFGSIDEAEALLLEKVLAGDSGQDAEFCTRLRQCSYVMLQLPSDVCTLIARVEAAASAWFAQDDCFKIQQAGKHCHLSDGMFIGYSQSKDGDLWREHLEVRQDYGGKLYTQLHRQQDQSEIDSDSFSALLELLMYQLDEWARGLLRHISMALGVHYSLIENILDKPLPNKDTRGADVKNEVAHGASTNLAALPALRHACLRVCRYDCKVFGDDCNDDVPTFADGCSVGCSEHTDAGLITLSVSALTPGLQVLRCSDSRWQSLESASSDVQNSRYMTVMVGDTLAALSGSHFSACRHRVLVPPQGERIGLPYLFRAQSNAVINTLPLLNAGSERPVHVAGIDDTVAGMISSWRGCDVNSVSFDS